MAHFRQWCVTVLSKRALLSKSVLLLVAAPAASVLHYAPIGAHDACTGVVQLHQAAEQVWHAMTVSGSGSRYHPWSRHEHAAMSNCTNCHTHMIVQNTIVLHHASACPFSSCAAAATTSAPAHTGATASWQL
jgi:hypothetical protein